MLSTYFRIAWRHLTKNKVYSFINIAGLATGMAIALVIGLWITDELTFDQTFANHSRVAKVMTFQNSSNMDWTGDVVSVPVGHALKAQYPDLFSHVVSATFEDGHIVAFGDKKINVSGFWAQSDFPKVFPLKITYGSANAFTDPSVGMISRSLATSLFGEGSPIGKAIQLDNKLQLKIGAVYEDFPDNSSFRDQQVVLPWDNKENSYMSTNTDWDNHNGRLFVELKEGVTAEQATARIRQLPTKHIVGWKEESVLQPLDRAYLYAEFTKGRATGGRISFVRMFAIIGAFVLLLACINFMNLSTARSEKRAREVGIRKTVGSLKGQLIALFLSESILVVILAFGLSLLITGLSLPFFNSLAAKKMVLPLSSPSFYLAALGFILVTGLLAGSYPAFYLSSFNPVKVLKGSFKAGRGASIPRQILVVLQFSVSLSLIIGTIIIFLQIEFAKNRPIGYNRDGLVVVDINTDDLNKNYLPLRNELLSKGLVENIAASSQAVTGFGSNNQLYWRGKTPDQESIFFRNVNITPDFGKTTGWTIIRGRDFSRDFPTDSTGMIINQAAANTIGIKDPIGETLKMFGKNYHVIGVAKDMLTNDPYHRIEPAVFMEDPNYNVITIRVKPGMSMSQALAGLEPVFKKYNPGSPFVYYFNDELYARKFVMEQRIGRLASVFTLLAIFISCLGLFGLASFIAEQRTKEIGVRKILGAGVFRLWGLLSAEFLRLVIISMFIAIPLSWFCMSRWLQGYTYRTPLSWYIFAAAALGILLITLLTVSYQALKAATMSPVKSLRSE